MVWETLEVVLLVYFGSEGLGQVGVEDRDFYLGSGGVWGVTEEIGPRGVAYLHVFHTDRPLLTHHFPVALFAPRSDVD